MYLMLATRPDICFAVSFLSRMQDEATDNHFAHLKRVLRYLKGTQDFKLVYTRGNERPLQGYADADWANDPTDRKSTSGFLLQVFGSTVFWSSKKQALVATSTTEAEYVSACLATMEANWLTKLLNDLNIDAQQPIPIYEDNNGCIFISQNPETKRSKHIDVNYHYLRELVWNKKIELVGIQSKEQVADCLTKSLARVQFLKFVEALGLKRGGVLK